MDNVNNLWANVVQGLAMIEIDGVQSFHQFESGYDAESKILTLSILDNDGVILTLNGNINITLMLTDCVETQLVQNSVSTLNMNLRQGVYISR